MHRQVSRMEIWKHISTGSLRDSGIVVASNLTHLNNALITLNVMQICNVHV